MSDIVNETLKSRRAGYGDSWLTPSKALDAILNGNYMKLAKLVTSGHFANWFLILGKLCRAIHSPDNPDHWIDIAGYAEISRLHIEEKNGNPPDPELF